MMSHRFNTFLIALLLLLLAAPSPVIACPFCNAVSQTLRQEMEAMDTVVIATALQSDAQRNKENGEVEMKVTHVLKGAELVSVGQTVNAIYYGEVKAGRTFMLSGVDPPDLQWSCLPLSDRGKKYVIDVTELDDDDLARLRFFHKFLEDEETMLARDAYDEFASAPYTAIRGLKPDMDHDQLVKWIGDTEMGADRKRLYLTMLGVCGTEKDLPLLEEIMSSTQKSSRSGLDALIACYLTLAGEKGLPLINELFLANKKAPYADTYAAIMAVRFHGTEGEVIPRSALVESLHHVLERKDLADLVIPDLARWGDWSQIDRLVDLFAKADKDNNWVRVPVVNYLRACPLPAGDEALKKLEKIDPESVRRANTFFSIPIPAKDTGSSNSSNVRKSEHRFVSIPVVSSSSGPTASSRQPIAAGTPVAAISGESTSNPWTLVYVVAMGLATIMIMQFLLLSGGAAPDEVSA